MSWIKRNLLFVIGAAVALLLMVGAGFYTWTGWSHNSKALDDLNGKYEELKRLTNLNPNPGSGKVDNIKAAREQQQTIRSVLGQAAKQFEIIHAIPEGANVTVEGFANSLSRTIFSLQREATNAGVALTPKYSFSFQQQSSLMKFAAGSVGPLAVQLGEVRALCDVLIAAKVNALDSIQRERVSADDQAGQQTDYVDLKSETNELAVLTPYQITFRSFTPELALVLCGFANSPKGIIVKSINVELAPVTVVEATPAPVMIYTPAPVVETPRPTQPNSAFLERYGRYGLGKDAGGMRPPPTYTPPPVAAPVAAPVSTAPRAVLNEKQIKVTMLVQVVKLLPRK
jgi:hypothetical protein